MSLSLNPLTKAGSLSATVATAPRIHLMPKDGLISSSLESLMYIQYISHTARQKYIHYAYLHAQVYINIWTCNSGTLPTGNTRARTSNSWTMKTSPGKDHK